MKKVLFATTALVASASIAAAEMTLSGSAEMGIKGGDRYDDGSGDAGQGNDPRFHQDFTLKFVGSGETDNGLTFGMNVELDMADTDTPSEGSGSNTDNEFVFISGAFGTLTLGEVDGAFDKRNIEVALAGGTLADDETEHAGYYGGSTLEGVNDNQILRYDYDFGDFGFSASVEQGDDGNSNVAGVQDDVYGIGVGWDGQMGGLGVGLGLAYATSDGVDFGAGAVGTDIWGLSGKLDFGNGFMMAASYTSIDVDAANSDGEHYAIGAAYTMDAWTFAANWGEYDWEGGAPLDDADGWGVLVNYDLGGGAVLQGGYGDGEGEESWSFGVAMSF